MNLTEQKQQLRKEVSARRRACPESDLSGMSTRITERILLLDEYRNAETVFAYMDIPGEVQTHSLIRQCLKDGKKVAVPRVRKAAESQPDEAAMHFYEIRDFDHLVSGIRGIPEPDPSFCPCLDHEEKALVIMPGVAFDRNLNRIGYGGGCYDRYLARHPDHPTAAVAFDFQVFDAVPCEATDIRPQILVTPHTVFRLIP